ncbi:MAG: hypothetical protein FWB98_05075, partial [Defluviitaleaceae bacterium]|nr:hypothetical protein [Defluviitaleaceae bacterium]
MKKRLTILVLAATMMLGSSVAVFAEGGVMLTESTSRATQRDIIYLHNQNLSGTSTLEFICNSELPEGVVPLEVGSIEEAIFVINQLHQTNHGLESFEVMENQVLESSVMPLNGQSTGTILVATRFYGQASIFLQTHMTTRFFQQANGSSRLGFVALSPFTTANTPPFLSWQEISVHAGFLPGDTQAIIRGTGEVRYHLIIPGFDWTIV